MVELLLLFPLLLMAVLSAIQLAIAVKTFRNAPKPQTPFERQQPSDLKMLFIGDSSAVGTGTTTPWTSVAGWFGQDFPAASIRNISANGKTLDKVAQELDSLEHDHFRLVVVQAGGNDILMLRKIPEVEQDLTRVVQAARRVGDYVVLIHCGDMGTAPILIWPFTWLYSVRTKKIRKLFGKQENDRVLYVDLMAQHQDQHMAKQRDVYYAKDGLHLTGTGYRYWYLSILLKMQQAHVRL